MGQGWRRWWQIGSWGDRKHWEVTIGDRNVCRWCAGSKCEGSRHPIRVRRKLSFRDEVKQMWVTGGANVKPPQTPVIRRLPIHPGDPRGGRKRRPDPRDYRNG
jgi:hypothetical protein